MKTRKSSARNKRWRFCHSALVLAMASLGSMAEADDLGGALNFYSKPKQATAASLTGGSLQGELVASTRVPAADVVNAPEAQPAAALPTAPASVAAMVNSASATRSQSATRASQLDMSLPAEVESGASASGLGQAESSLAYIREMVNTALRIRQIAEVDPGRRSEVTQARARLLQAETARDLVQSKLQEQKTTLTKLVGTDVTAPANAKWDWTPISLNQALEQMVDQPALRQAKWEKEAALAGAESVKSSRMPKLNWVVGRNTGNNMLDNKEPWSTGLAVEWNAFSGGSASAAQRAAYARAEAADQKMEATRRESEYRIRNLVEQRDLSASRAGDYEELLAESDRVRKMFYDQWYHLGKRTLLDVLIAENDYYSQQIAAADTYYSAKASDLRVRAETSGLLAWLAPGSEAASR